MSIENIVIVLITLGLGFYGLKIYSLIHTGTEYLKTKAKTEWAKEALDFLDFSLKKAIMALQATARKEIDADFKAGKLNDEAYKSAKASLMATAIANVKTSKSDLINYLKSRFGCSDEEVDALLKEIGEGHLEDIKKK